MGTKRYIVREGFNFRTRDEKGNEKVYSEGDVVTLEQSEGDGFHQLEYADERDRTAAFKAEQEAKRMQEAAIATATGGIDPATLANAIAAGVAQALAAQTAAAPAQA